MFERILDSRSAGVLFIVGGFHLAEMERNERLQAQMYAAKTYTKFVFVTSSVVNKPKHCLSPKERELRDLVFQGLRRSINLNGFEKITLFGCFLTEFMREVVVESRHLQKPLEFRATPDSVLERYGRLFESRNAGTRAAYRVAEAMGIRAPG